MPPEQTGIIRPAGVPPAEWDLLYSSFLGGGAMYAIFWPPTEASTIRPPFGIVNTATPLA